MSKMLSLRAFLSERLAAAAEEIFGAVEKTIAEYKEEISRSKDLEISRLRMQLKLLKSDTRADRCLGAQMQQQQQHTHHHHHHHPPPQQQQHHQSVAAVDPPQSQHCEDDDEEEDEGSSMEQEHPEPSQVKKEQQKSHRDFWMGHDTEQLENLESDIKTSSHLLLVSNPISRTPPYPSTPTTTTATTTTTTTAAAAAAAVRTARTNPTAALCARSVSATALTWQLTSDTH
ncbi:hypothetical protein INR49_001635, partial [Caranx melampygus]